MTNASVQAKKSVQSRSLSFVSDSKLKSNISIQGNRASAPTLPSGYTIRDMEFKNNGAAFVVGTKDITNYGSPAVVGRNAFVAKISANGKLLWEKIIRSANGGSAHLADVELFRNRVIAVGLQGGGRSKPFDNFLGVDLSTVDGSNSVNALKFGLSSAEGLSLKVSGNLLSATAKTFKGFDVNGYPNSQAVPETWNFFYNLTSNTLLDRIKIG